MRALLLIVDSDTLVGGLYDLPAIAACK